MSLQLRPLLAKCGATEGRGLAVRTVYKRVISQAEPQERELNVKNEGARGSVAAAPPTAAACATGGPPAAAAWRGNLLAVRPTSLHRSVPAHHWAPLLPAPS